MNDEAVSAMVKRFLRLMEGRDLESAESMMAPGAKIIFPGGRIFDNQRQMVEASRGRYRWVKKTIDRIDVLREQDAHRVYVLGTLYGVNRNEVPFDGIRFIHCFLVTDGRIVRQEVWNDLAESGVLEQLSFERDPHSRL